MTTGNESLISLEQFAKWAKTRSKDLTKARKALEKTSADLESVLKEHLDKANWRALRNRINKLRRETPTASRLLQAVKRELAWEAKRFDKLLEHSQPRQS